MIVAGIDPGKNGAIAILDSKTGELLELHDMPLNGDEVNGWAIHEILLNAYVEAVVVEDVKTIMVASKSTNMKLGKACGVIHGVVIASGRKMLRLTPQSWKKTMGLLKKEKKHSLGLARELWPHMTDDFKHLTHADRAEAALIAEAARRSNLL